MYAIVECGGRQYRAEAGQTLSVEKLPIEVGEQITLSNVYLLSNGSSIQVGQPSVEGASVIATVTEQYRGKKIFVWKYKPKKRYRRRRGRRNRCWLDAVRARRSDSDASRPYAEQQRAGTK